MGLGHLRRMEALLSPLAARGFEVRAVAGSAFSLEYVRNGWPCETVSARSAQSQGRSTTLAIVDLPYSGDAIIRRYQGDGVPVIAIDHQGKVVPEATVVLDSELRLVEGTVHFSGLNFALIRPLALGTQSGNTGRPVVSIGGSDPLALGPKAASRLWEIGLSPLLVSGPASLSRPQRLPKEISNVVSPPDFTDRILGAQFVVVNGGTTMLESLHLGKPTFVVPQTDGELAFAKRMERAGLVLGVGIDSLRTPSVVEVNKARVQGPAAVDGRGSERIATLAHSLIHNRDIVMAGHFYQILRGDSL